MEDDPSKHGATDHKVKLGGTDLAEDQLHGFVVDMDLSQADMCTLTLKNSGHKYSNKVKHCDPLEIKVGDLTVFKGEVVSIEPLYKTGAESKCVVRAYNRMHRLLRGRKTRTWLKKSYQDIAADIAKDADLKLTAGSSPNVKHEHIYQHNQDNLAFLRVLAGRIGYDVWVEDETLYFDAPKLDKDSGIELKIDNAEDPKNLLTAFTPRMSSASIVKKVTVRGWDPEKKEEIVGEAEVSGSKLGPKTGSAATGKFGSTLTYEVDYPIFSAQEAEMIAKARLGELSMSYITGEGATSKGNPALKPGMVVKLTINVDEATDRFNGKYLLIGCCHSYIVSKGGNDKGGLRTVFRVRRDAQSEGGEGSDQPPPEEIPA